MSEQPHVSDTPGHKGTIADHDVGDYGEDHGQVDHAQDDHAHGDEPLGPVDVIAWGAGLLGVALGLVVAVAFAAATGMV